MDSSRIKSLISIIDPGFGDPAWFYIASFRRSAGVNPFGEIQDTKDIYDWTSSGATDSVFTYAGSVRSLKQAAVVSNTIEKDSNGDIIKITRNQSFSGMRKVMQIKY